MAFLNILRAFAARLEDQQLCSRVVQDRLHTARVRPGFSLSATALGKGRVLARLGG
jgi:hypothetical protein